MVKCGACGKFLSPTDVAKCIKCPASYHRSCVGLPESSRVASTWTCPTCKPKKLKGDNAETPVKPLFGEDLELSDNQSFDRPHKIRGTPELVTPLNTNCNLLDEIRSFRSELNTVRREIQEYRNEVAEFKCYFETCNSRIDALSNRMDSVECQFKDYTPPIVDELQATISRLKQEMNDREQMSFINDVEITNIPEEKNENLAHLVTQLTLKLGMNLDKCDIVHAERVGHRQESSNVTETARPRSIAVRFVRRSIRDKILQEARVRRNATTEDLQLSASPRKFYVNERLSKLNRFIFYKARECCRIRNWKYVWTKNGRILMREVQGKSTIRVRTLDDLTRVFGSELVGAEYAI